MNILKMTRFELRRLLDARGFKGQFDLTDSGAGTIAREVLIRLHLPRYVPR